MTTRLTTTLSKKIEFLPICGDIRPSGALPSTDGWNKDNELVQSEPNTGQFRCLAPAPNFGLKKCKINRHGYPYLTVPNFFTLVMS